VARNTIDRKHTELTLILEDLLAQNLDITAREAARRHSLFSDASTITRHPDRRALLADYQKRQQEARRCVAQVVKSSKEDTANKLAGQQHIIDELTKKVEILTTGHLALFKAVGKLGGTAKLVKYYDEYREVRNSLVGLGALPKEISTPIPLRPAKRQRK
jgi:hypothetical protein